MRVRELELELESCTRSIRARNRPRSIPHADSSFYARRLDQLPDKYGGGLVVTGGAGGVWDCKEEVLLREHVYSLEENRREQAGREAGIGDCPERRRWAECSATT